MANKVILGGLTTSEHTIRYQDILAFVDSYGAPRHLLYEVAGAVCDTFTQDYKKSLMALLEESGSTRTTRANWVGHREKTRTYKNFTILAAAAASGAGAAVVWTVAPTSHFQGRVLAQVGDQLQIAGSSRMFVQVIGKDSGGTNHRLGVNASGVAITPGSLSGTPTTIKLVVKPIIATDTIPAMLTTDLLTDHSTSVGIGSCPVDGVVRDDDEYKYGFSYVRSDIEFTGNTRFKDVACTYKDATSKSFVDDQIGVNILNHFRKVQNKLLFVPNSTNTGLTVNGEERDESNGLIPQIQQNGGLTTTYTTWTFANFRTIVRYLKNQGGASKYMIKGGYAYIEALMDSLRSENITAVVKQIILPASGGANKEICINLDYSCFTYNGVEFYFQEWDVMTDPEMAGATYSGDAIFWPMSDTLAINPDRTTENRKKMTVWFEQGQNGAEDHMNMWYRDEKKSTGCLRAGWAAHTALNLETFCMNQFVYVQKV